MPTINDLYQKRAMPLEAKIAMSLQRIREFYEGMDGNVYISFSGGKDSTVMADLVRRIYPDVPMVFINTGLEFPEIQRFAREMGATIIRPKLSFPDVLTRYGYPILTKEIAESIFYARRILNGSKRVELSRTTLSRRKALLGQRTYAAYNGTPKAAQSRYNKKRWLPLTQEADFLISSRCCFFMKKSGLGKYHRKMGLYPYIGTLTEESNLRKEAWLRTGCNSFDKTSGASRPLSFWREQDVIEYIRRYDLPYSDVYGDIVQDKKGVCSFSGQQRTGCIFCGFGLGIMRDSAKFTELAHTHPRQYEYCLEGGQYINSPLYDPKAPEYDGEWKNWNPKKIWVPSKEGLGMRHVFETMNHLYGDDFIKY